LKNKKILGDFGEAEASNYLVKNGYTILDKNFRILQGEIDIIALQQNILCFIEVKTRKNTDFGLACEAVNYKKQQTIRFVASIYLNTHKIKYEEIRFDVIEIYTDTEEIIHLENAF
jgi:archaeal holliday junction resolvase (hjc)